MGAFRLSARWGGVAVLIVMGGMAGNGWAVEELPVGYGAEQGDRQVLEDQVAGLVVEEALGPPPEHRTWREFFRQRTRWMVGVEEEYQDNVFLTRGSQKQDDYITALTSQIEFADPRGDWLYGGGYEVETSRYLEMREQHFSHTLRTYAYYTPLSRYRIVLAEQLTIEDRLVAGPSRSDVIRRFATSTRSIANLVKLGATYDLDPTDALRLTYDFGITDDEAVDAANVNSIIHRLTAGIEHDMSRRWEVFGGFKALDTSFAEAPEKDSLELGVALESRLDLDRATTSRLTVDVTRRNSASLGAQLDVEFGVVLARALAPRTRWSLELDRKISPSTGASAQTFESNVATLHVAHQVTRTIEAEWTNSYEHQESDLKRSDRWETALGLKWVIKPTLALSVNYEYGQLNPDEIAHHTALVRLEALLW